MKYGRYKVVEELGKGAMGVVYKAHDPHIDRLVALKVLREDRVTSEAFVRRFLKEAMAIGRLSHANIVTVYDVGRDRGTVFIAEEFLEGTPLDELLKQRSLEPEEIVNFGGQMAEALYYAHQKGIVHRDIKPSNIIFTPEGQVKITDFGIAHIEDPGAPQLTQAGEILGTPFYMSPEQLMGRTIDGRSDIFSLGVMLYEMAAGKRPFTGKSLPAIFHAITGKNPDPPDQVATHIPGRLSEIILKALEKNPEDRYGSGKELADDLKTVEIRKISPGPEETGKKKRGKSKAPAMAAIAVLLIFLGVGGYIATRPDPVPPTTPVPPAGPVTDPTPAPPVATVPGPETVAPATLAVLKVESEPDGAQVFLDGQLKGSTPLDIEVPLGKYEVRLSKQNFYEWEAQVNLEEAGQTPLFIKLNPLIF